METNSSQVAADATVKGKIFADVAAKYIMIHHILDYHINNKMRSFIFLPNIHNIT